MKAKIIITDRPRAVIDYTELSNSYKNLEEKIDDPHYWDKITENKPIEIENVKEYEAAFQAIFYWQESKDKWKALENNQTCEIELTETGCRVTSINTEQ